MALILRRDNRFFETQAVTQDRIGGARLLWIHMSRADASVLDVLKRWGASFLGGDKLPSRARFTCGSETRSTIWNGGFPH